MGLTRRDWVLGAIAWTVLAGASLALSMLMAMTEDAQSSGALWGLLVAVLFGPGVVIGAASLAVFGARGRIKNAIGIAAMTFGVLVVVMLVSMAGGMLHAPRYLAYGKLAGSVAEVAGHDAASVEIAPAFADVSRIGHGSESSGKSSTERYVAPIVPALSGELDRGAVQREPIVLFLCDSDEGDLRAAAARPGPVSGRMHPMTLRAEKRALDSVPNLVRGAGKPQCVVPASAWSTVWVILWLLLVLIATTGGAIMAAGIARPDPAPAEKTT